MTLLHDITRCLGEGSSGRVCIMRQHCRRYLERNRGIERGTVSMAMMLCRTPRHEQIIPAPEMETVK